MNDRFARAGAIARVDLAHEPDFALGRIEVRPSLRELAGEGWRETIDRRVMQVLVALARANGKVVSRDDLIESCWGGVIVGDEAINRCISRLRKAAEASGNAFSIETLSRVGYRLKIAEAAPSTPAERAAAAAASASSFLATAEPAQPQSASPAAASPAKARWTSRSYWPAAVAALLVLGTAAGISGWPFFWHARPKALTITDNALAVLPFVNMSGNSARDFISDGISEELLDELSNISALRVAARTSSFAFKGRNTDVKQIARILSVHSVLEGSIREDGRHIRISAQLIDGTDGFRIWSATYDRQMTGMLTLEDDIARAITAAITHRILPAPRISAGRPASIDPDVYSKYLEGLHDLAPRDEAGVTKAVALFREVTAAQPDFAAGFAALGRALINHAENHPGQQELLPEAQAALAHALALDPNNIAALGAHADLALHWLDWKTAAADTRRMRTISPNSSAVLHEMFRYYQFLGFPERALEAAQGAALLDPLSEVDRLNVTAALIHLARFGESAAVARAALDRMPGHIYIRSILCTAYAHSGELEKSRAIAAQFSRAHDKPDTDACLFDIAVGEGKLDDARRINDAFAAEYPNGSMRAVDLADNFAVIGDAHATIQWMERAYAQKDFEMFEVPFDRAIPQAVFADSGWKALMQRPLFRDWQAAHDRLGAELGAGE
ncbi:MAG TPA: winged helix-turn-helix domain-containing protein [Rhizomicrobium sp.]|jgi:TolB-like protein/DNA-binding winged helix-turn-helix (wHTH) protein/tetratricopeptide (TPR) repeat protein|nr:winged helix-turn-helix domain-containing protein [Rhizomicrobium sp.]